MSDKAQIRGDVVATKSIDVRTQLDNLAARATALYARKEYDEAAEVYAEACSLQEDLYGELAPENANLLYCYGRCLYHVAIIKSDVLGGKVATEAPVQQEKKRKAGEVEDASFGATSKKIKTDGYTHLEINGDDVDWTSEEGELDDEQVHDDADEQQDDDFAIAWDILDMARCILVKKLAEGEMGGQHGEDERKVNILSVKERNDKEILADIFDLQAEIAMEDEKFDDAVENAREALALKRDLYSDDSNLLGEAHFKLSLALEFASVTKAPAEPEQRSGELMNEMHNPRVDEAIRREAIEQMELSLHCTRRRLDREQYALVESPNADDAQKRSSEIANVKEMLEEMEQRLTDLKAPAVSLLGPTPAAPAVDDNSKDSIQKLLGSLMGGMEGITRNAKDLTATVRKKDKKHAVSIEPSVGTTNEEREASGQDGASEKANVKATTNPKPTRSINEA